MGVGGEFFNFVENENSPPNANRANVPVEITRYCGSTLDIQGTDRKAVHRTAVGDVVSICAIRAAVEENFSICIRPENCHSVVPLQIRHHRGTNSTPAGVPNAIALNREQLLAVIHPQLHVGIAAGSRIGRAGRRDCRKGGLPAIPAEPRRYGQRLKLSVVTA